MNPINIVFHFTAENAEAFRKEQAMSYGQMSKDRVLFFLGDRYYSGGECANFADMQKLLSRSFGIPMRESHKLIHQGMDVGGFWIVCRPSQFARFMIYRNEMHFKNGFVDLAAKLQPACPVDPVKKLANMADVTHEQAYRVACTMSLSDDDIWDKIGGHETHEVVDVSQNPAENKE